MLDSDISEIVANLPIAALDELRGKHILITGGRGFLGRYFTAVFNELWERVPQDPIRVTAIDNYISAGAAGRELPSMPYVTFLEHDVAKPITGLRGLAINSGLERVDYIIYAAGIASPAHYRTHPLETIDVATTGLRNSLELARANPGCRLVFFSSSEIYGDPTEGNVPTPETYRGNVACLGSRACYDESKRLGETLVQVYHQQYGVHGSIIRPFNVYGPGMQPTDYRVLPNFAAKIALGEPLQVYGDGKQTRTYCYVVDAVGGFLRVLLSGRAGEPYNIGNPTPEISVLGLAKKIQKILPDEIISASVMPHPPSYPADEPNRRCPDITKAARELGYAPRVQLDEGLRRFFNWALANFPKERAA